MSKKITLKCSPASYHRSGLLQGWSCGLPTFAASVPAAHLLLQIQIRSSVYVGWEESEIRTEFWDSWDSFKVIFAEHEIFRASQSKADCSADTFLDRKQKGKLEARTAKRLLLKKTSHVSSCELKLFSSSLLTHLPRNSLRKMAVFENVRLISLILWKLCCQCIRKYH